LQSSFGVLVHLCRFATHRLGLGAESAALAAAVVVAVVEHSAVALAAAEVAADVGKLAAAKAPAVVAAAVGAVADTLGTAVVAVSSWVHRRSQEVAPRRATNFVSVQQE
jgi:hypothetical protein